MHPQREWNISALAAAAGIAMALPVFCGRALTPMDVAAVTVLTWVLLGRATGITWSDVWRVGTSNQPPKYHSFNTLHLRVYCERHIL